MNTPIALTFEVLAKSRNDSANDVLLAAFTHESGQVFVESLKTILSRRNKEAHRAVLERWHELDESEKEILLQSRGHIAAALRDAVLAEDTQLFTNACQIIERAEEYDLVPNLVTLAEHTTSPHANHASTVVLTLAGRLNNLLYNPARPNVGSDPQVFRKNFLDILNRSLDRFRYHKRIELLEAFCLLCGATDDLLLTILDDPHHPCFKGISQVLATNTHSAIVHLLVDLFRSEKAPATVLSIVSHRSDRKFLCRFFASYDQKKSASFSRNLSRIRTFSWLNVPTYHLSSFDEEDQVRAVKLLSATGISPNHKLDALEELLLKGEPAGRAAACDALAEFSGDHTNHMILQAVYDTAPQVQAAATRQLRNRHIPGTMPLLSDLLDSPHEEVRTAAREALSEFSFENFVRDYDGLSDEVRQTTGSLVQRVDEEYLPRLKTELSAQGVKRRLRAIEIAKLLEVVPYVVDDLITLLGDNDHVVRATAAEALQYWPVPEVQAALEVAAHDRSGTVQNAARSSLAVFTNLQQPTSSGLSEVL